ncbi:hypothetical protein JCM3765_001880 [Sporobolomyces pararoseus]
MSFNQLPNETIELIVKKCAEADQAYSDRKGEQKIKRTKSAGVVRDPRGRSCRELSMTCKSLRSITVKYIFHTLAASRAQDETFKMLILGSPLADNFVKLDFDCEENLLELVVQIVPRLPNLRAVKGLTLERLELIVGPSGLANPPIRQPVINSSHIRARQAFLEMAKQITDWAIELPDWEAVNFLSASPSSVQRLDLSSGPSHDFSILDSDNSGFRSILSRLPNLLSLNVLQGRPKNPPDAFTPVSDSVLKTTFPFANSLRSLTFESLRDDQGTIHRDIRLATLFPSLRTLVISFETRGSWQVGDDQIFTLPRLEYLEIKSIEPQDVSPFLHSLILPSINEIHFDSIEIHPPDLPVIYAWEEKRRSRPLNFSGDTLRIVRISDTYDFEPRIIDFLLFPPVKLVLDSRTRLAFKPTQIYDSTSELPYFAQRQRQIYSTCAPSFEDPIYERTDQLLKWARERAEKLKYRDVDEGRELLEALRVVEELKEWSEL